MYFYFTGINENLLVRNLIADDVELLCHPEQYIRISDDNLPHVYLIIRGHSMMYDLRN
jgi:hypothetical protein